MSKCTKCGGYTHWLPLCPYCKPEKEVINMKPDIKHTKQFHHNVAELLYKGFENADFKLVQTVVLGTKFIINNADFFKEGYVLLASVVTASGIPDKYGKIVHAWGEDHISGLTQMRELVQRCKEAQIKL